MSLHTVLLVSTKNSKSQLLYKIDDLAVLRDDMSYAYHLSSEEVDELIDKGEFKNDRYLFLYHKFEW